MASVRDIKKDINYLTYEVLSDCMIYKHMHSEDAEKTDEIMKDMIEKREELITRVNEAKKLGDRKKTREAFNAIMNDGMKAADESFGKLSKLAK
ncbi:MAG TPA: hypothetical protein VJ946_09280 [Bacteroidales bacterium]|nr:hypothetical protein [Bacteroidales bacterium]